MAKKQRSVELSVSSDNFWDGLKGIAKSAADALADGWQPGADLPAIALGSMQNFLEIMHELSNLKKDMQEDAFCASKTHALNGLELAEAMYKALKKPDAPEAN